MIDRRALERRSDALAAWRGTERRIAHRRALVSARQAHWFNRFTAAKAAQSEGN